MIVEFIYKTYSHANLFKVNKNTIKYKKCFRNLIKTSEINYLVIIL